VGGIPDVTDCDLHVNQKYLKPDSSYGWGVIWMDNYGYKSAVQTIPELSFTTAPYNVAQGGATNYYNKANGLYFTLPLATTSNAPSWATHFMLVRTYNRSVEWFAQGRVNNALYCTGYTTTTSGGNPPVTTPDYILNSPGPGNPNLGDVGTIELHFDLSNWTQFGNNIPYIFEPGDKVTVLTTGGNYQNVVDTATGGSVIPIGDSQSVIEYAAPSALAHLNIISQVGSLLKVDYSTAYLLNLNGIANPPDGAVNVTQAQTPPGMVTPMITVGNYGFIAVFGYGSVNDSTPGYAFPNNPLTNLSPTKSNLNGVAMSGKYAVVVDFSIESYYNLILMVGDNGELWINGLQTQITLDNFDFTNPTWVQLTSGVTTSIRSVVFDYDNFIANGTYIFWACGDSGVILKISSSTAVPATFIVTPFTNSALGNLTSICSVITSQWVCGENGMIAYYNGTSFVQCSGSPITCNKLNCIVKSKNGTVGGMIIVGDAGTILGNASSATGAYSNWSITPTTTGADLYSVTQYYQYNAFGLGYLGVANKWAIVGEGNIFYNLNTTSGVPSTYVITDQSGTVNLTTGNSLSSAFQYSYESSTPDNLYDIYVRNIRRYRKLNNNFYKSRKIIIYLRWRYLQRNIIRNRPADN
jgi:hypothetical protein